MNNSKYYVVASNHYCIILFDGKTLEEINKEIKTTFQSDYVYTDLINQNNEDFKRCIKNYRRCSNGSKTQENWCRELKTMSIKNELVILK